jgi:hypothetical protein
MNQLSHEELRKIPYADLDVLGGRAFLLMPLWDGVHWHQWVQTGNTTLTEIAVHDVVRANYVAKRAAAHTDLWIPFVDFAWQRACWPEIFPFIVVLCDNLHHLATSVAKLRYFFYTKDHISSDSISSFAETELEYLIVLSRAVFDLLQNTIAALWNEHITLLDPTAEARRKGRKLPPDRFRKMVLINDKSATSEDLINKYALSPALADAYVRRAPFFMSLRLIRDKLVHSGSHLSPIFVTEKGFCVSPRDKPFADFPIWRQSHYYNENLVYLLPLVRYIVCQTVRSCNDLIISFASEVQFPPEIAAGYRVFIRDPAGEALLDLLKLENGDTVCWEER